MERQEYYSHGFKDGKQSMKLELQAIIGQLKEDLRKRPAVSINPDLNSLERDVAVRNHTIGNLKSRITALKKSLDESYTDGEKLQDDYQDVKEENIDLKSRITALEEFKKTVQTDFPLVFGIISAELDDKGSAARKPSECQGCDRGFITVILPNGAKQIAECVPCKESSPIVPQLSISDAVERMRDEFWETAKMVTDFPTYKKEDEWHISKSDFNQIFDKYISPLPKKNTQPDECPECTEGDHDATIK